MNEFARTVWGDFPVMKTDSTLSEGFVMTESRQRQAEVIDICVQCNLPVLLEGMAAVGKTELVKSMAAYKGVSLERVNNSDTTTVQDYMGSYIPVGKAFVFQQGALFRAMVEGCWFLADEFNLAHPDVMNMLCPLLDGLGELEIPGKGTVVAHPDFRIFATQNPGSYANRHRLPLSLRNRFLEVQINDFSETDLVTIISNRKEVARGAAEPVPLESARKMAKTYVQLRQTEHVITMREIIKWARRQTLYGYESTLGQVLAQFCPSTMPRMPL